MFIFNPLIFNLYEENEMKKFVLMAAGVALARERLRRSRPRCKSHFRQWRAEMRCKLRCPRLC